MDLLGGLLGNGDSGNGNEGNSQGLMDGLLGGDESESEESLTTDSSTGSSEEQYKNSSIRRVPITDRDEAMDFALTEWNKIRRGSGHSIECQVFGSNHWQVGEWCKVYLPTLNEYTDMYITKIDNSNDSGSEWLTNITLSDYAPSLSQLEEEDVEKTKDNSSSATGDGTGSGDEEGDANKWTQIAQILQDNYEKPSGGWDSIIRTIKDATVYDPTIKDSINKLKQKNSKSYVQVGHELCNVVGIGY